MDLLAAVGPGEAVQETALTHRLLIDGHSDIYKVYRIRLDMLRYNKGNDRIATWVSKYRAEHAEGLPDESDVVAFNDVIERLVVESNEQAIRRTANNIRLFDQRVPVVVLEDGLVVDGNRRFTCLRRLAREEPRFGWVEGVILPVSLADTPKRIKLLELAIQHGEENKVEYDPIDRLAGVYNDIIAQGILTMDEYAQGCNVPLREVRNMVEQASYVAEFLDFVNCPRQFHLVRELGVLEPLREVPAIMRACRTREEEETVKQLIFANLVVEPERDATRFIRRFRRILSSPFAKEFVEDEVELAAEVVDRLANAQSVSTQIIRDSIRADRDLTSSFARVMSRADARAKGARVLSMPHDNLQRASDYLDKVDPELFSHISRTEMSHVINLLDVIEHRLSVIRSYVPGGLSNED